MNAQNKRFLVGFFNKGQVPVLLFRAEQWDSHQLNKNLLKQSLDSNVTRERIYFKMGRRYIRIV